MSDEELRDELTVRYFNALVQGLSLEQVAKVPPLALANGEKFIDELMKLIESRDKQIRLKESEGYCDHGHYHDFERDMAMLPSERTIDLGGVPIEEKYKPDDRYAKFKDNSNMENK